MSESTQSEGEIGQEDISFDLEDKAGISNQTRSLAAIAIEGENDTIETVSAHNEEEPSQSSTNQSPSSTSIATEIKRDTTVCTFSVEKVRSKMVRPDSFVALYSGFSLTAIRVPSFNSSS